MKIDWKLVKKEYDKLGIPDDYYNPSLLPWNRNSWLILMSERSIGKTTNVLIIGLILYKLYGIVIQYIREIPDMIAKKNCEDLFAVIVREGYVTKMTGGVYNCIDYYGKKFRYAYYDEEAGKITHKSDVICNVLAITENAVLKSSYNAPKGDFIVFDEFISRHYFYNEFVEFCDLTKTIGRDREDIKIVLLANTIDPFSPMLEELEINNIAESLGIGQHEEIITSGGTPIYIELCGNVNPKRQLINRLFYGFKNPRLKAITGGGWSMSNYPHQNFNPEDVRIIDKSHFIQCNDSILVQLDICYHQDIGYFVNCHRATRTREDDVIWTISDIKSGNDRFGLGHTALDRFLVDLRSKNLWYYSSNLIGSVVTSYFKQVQTFKR